MLLARALTKVDEQGGGSSGSTRPGSAHARAPRAAPQIADGFLAGSELPLGAHPAESVISSPNPSHLTSYRSFEIRASAPARWSALALSKPCSRCRRGRAWPPSSQSIPACKPFSEALRRAGPATASQSSCARTSPRSLIASTQSRLAARDAAWYRRGRGYRRLRLARVRKRPAVRLQRRAGA